ncbi:MAG: protein kinase [Deltaproteobacteria bacterium]|nr:protein kinase [Deltaproteobacteria bacterium]
MTRTHELIGTVLSGRFQVVRVIGQGGMGTVFEAHHTTLPRRYAIKVLRQELAHNRDFVERFRREAIAAARVEHPNVIHISDFGQMESGALYLVMEYLEGIGLDEVLSRNVRLPLNRTLPILAQLADALDHAHRMQVVHRDLKPENILLTDIRDRKDVVKLLDFGIAKVLSPDVYHSSLTSHGQVFGTAEYMSPEQATGEPADGRADLYAVGCLAYELITGNPPFVGPPVTVLQAHVHQAVAPPSTRLKDHPLPPGLDALVLRCLAKDPAKRYQTGAELRQELLRLRAFLFTLGAELTTPPPDTHTHRKVSRKAMAEGWQSLGGRVPELLTAGAVGLAPVAGELAATPAPGPAQPAVDPDELRESLHQVLRELSIALIQAALFPAETSEALERLLVIEEENASLTGTIALAEQNFDRIRFEFGQREKRFRHAIMDLTMARAQVKGRATLDPALAADLQPQIVDLNFQIGELTKRCQELDTERAAQIRELDAEIKRYKEGRLEREQEAAEIYHALLTQVEALRPAAQAEPLPALYARLDEHRAALEAARKQG